MDRKKDADTLLDRHNKAMAAILRRFLNMTKAATAPIPKEGALDHEALNQMRMENETAALITEIQNLLQITREIKALWIKGPLRKPGEDAAQQAELDSKARVVQGLYNELMASRLERQKADAEAQARADSTAAES
ncbi:hypothetical protein JX265_002721 [Neoarthrinium moseri]|uniref:Mediator of RNA polymerase II transcription subunit 22 n=1 Tax=Neoarthrinium moseri TaxID=1658444 RepID=A0A9P9WVD0_9PEZI|nr:uncharacterized protein JN550_000532 [Neoarthrinium moseri]KAI1842674.1 hypothetical protein JX266_011136 [Neoarthrinium moseri]KAI1878350.1 hypothetical protein JN550_000532 [Neoarthrinium moseri]KAI1879767.1 hypothetical protein JX265_002721 [Neoarthrinium moseri]